MAMLKKTWAAAVFLLALTLRAELPPLHGDGVHDDTAAIQARLDSGAACVSLPLPQREYLISKTLRIGSRQELRLDRFAVIRLAPGSSCPMLENRGFYGETNEFIAVTGGIWDADNRNQIGNTSQIPDWQKKYPGVERPLGWTMRFYRVSNMTLKGVTFRNPVTYGATFCRVSYVSVDDITFDYRTWNPVRLNMDGIHLDGFCHHVRITNLRGTCFDDMVALNAQDVHCAIENGPISDVDIDGLYADYCHSAVRLLSTGHEVKRVTIRNVHGNYYVYAIGLTHCFPGFSRGKMDDIVISDVFASRVIPPPEVDAPFRRAMPLIHVEGAEDIGNLTIERVHRDEKTLGIDTIGIDAAATVRRLTVRDCKMDNRLENSIRFIGGIDRVATLVAENNEFLPSPDAWTGKSADDVKKK